MRVAVSEMLVQHVRHVGSPVLAHLHHWGWREQAVGLPVRNMLARPGNLLPVPVYELLQSLLARFRSVPFSLLSDWEVFHLLCSRPIRVERSLKFLYFLHMRLCLLPRLLSVFIFLLNRFLGSSLI